MFDIGFWELALIGMLALIVLGPKRLPEAARIAGYWLGRARNFIANAKSELDQHMQGGDMEEIRRLKEELDETRRYIQRVAGETGENLAGAIDDFDSEPENRIGGTTRAALKKPKTKKSRKKPATKKPVKKASSTAKKKTTRKKSAAKKSTRKKSARSKKR